MAATQTKEATQYEAMFLFGSGAAQDVQAAINTVRGIIERHGGEVLVLKKWDDRKLMYEINKQKRGVYIIAYYRAPGAATTAIERDVKLSEEVLRVLITKADHLNQEEMAAVEPQPIQPREERNPWDRPERGGFDRGPRDDRGRDDRGPRDERPRDDRPRDDRPREDRPPRAPRQNREEAPAGAASGGGAGGGEAGADKA